LDHFAFISPVLAARSMHLPRAYNNQRLVLCL